MKTINIIRKGFAVAYDRTDGTLGYLGTDDGGPGASGYPTFTKVPDYHHLYVDVAKALRDVKTLDGMKNYHGNDKVDFNSTRVVYYTEQAVTEEVDEALIQKHLVASAKEKLTEDELKALVSSHQAVG